VVSERLGGVEMVGHGDGGRRGLAAELFDPSRPRLRGCGVEARRIDRLEHRQALRAAFDDGLDPLDAGRVGAAVGDVGERVERTIDVGRELPNDRPGACRLRIRWARTSPVVPR
jgi:methyl coenzyme M reductase gamma subunit